MAWRSIKLEQEFESIALTIDSLLKTCILSGPTCTLSSKSELFRQLFGLKQELDIFCTAIGYGLNNKPTNKKKTVDPISPKPKWD